MKSLILSIMILSANLANSQADVPNDLLKAKIHKLKNGLTIYMTVNKVEPKIQTYIAVKAGSKFDPSDNTGLAHYLEHLMFKGTPSLGTTNWKEESKLLDQISDLYEKHKAEKDPAKKKAIYKEIDSMSYKASGYAVPNEYDKIITSLGAQGTNAYTSNDQTVYQNTIPSNELDKWLMLESERFQHLTMRLFHTELEAVYEEYNISQDNDGRWAYANLFKALFSNHPYGTQTTIGEGDHLKNPSMVNIRKYFEKYYVPNNVAICLSGDLDPEKTITLIEKHFGAWKSKDIKPFEMPVLPKIDKPIQTENFGPQEEFLYLGWRIPASNDKDGIKALVIDQIMANGVAGIIDLNVVQKQKTLAASSFSNTLNDASVYMLYGKPKQGQSLEQVKDILLEQMDKFKNGEFEEWLIQASINDLELKTIKGYESNQGRAGAFVAAFTKNIEWSDYASRIAEMRKFTKQDLIDFANKYYGDSNYAVSYKRKGKEEKPKVDKPKITPVQMNRETSSEFFKTITQIPSPKVEPIFVDFKTEIKSQKLASGVDFQSIKNKENNYAKYCIVFPFGSDNSKLAGLASKYLKFLGTATQSNENLKKELYRNGLEFNSNIARDRMVIILEGLEQNMKTGIKLLYENLSTCKVDTGAWTSLVSNTLKERENAKINKGAIFSGMVNYAKYGSVNPFNTQLKNEELKSLSPSQLVEFLHKLPTVNHSIFYYGQDEKNALSHLPKEYSSNLTTYAKGPEKIANFKVQDNSYDKVLLFNYPSMVQAQIMLTNNGGQFDLKQMPFNNLFNDFFGSGLSSIVFQELREQKALAYSAYTFLGMPSVSNEQFFLQAFIGTQADKMPTAAKEFKKLLNTQAKVEIQFKGAKESALKQIASDRVVRDNIFWTFLNNKRFGIDYDFRKDIYKSIQTETLQSFNQKFTSLISNKIFTTVLMGDKTKMNLDEVKEFGHPEEITVDKVFGY